MFGFRHFGSALLLFFSGFTCLAQKDLLQGINLGSEAGFSRLMTEIPLDFSGLINEFDHQSGLTYNFQLSKYITPHWEVGTGINYANLKGHAANPDFSAEGINEPGIISIGEIEEPVEYTNSLRGQDLFVRYFFKNAAEQDHFNLNPFVKLGVGYINYKPELVFADDGEMVPGTSRSAPLTTGQFKLGSGFKAYLSGRLQLITSLDFNIIKYDYLDVVHNFSASGERLGVIGIYSELKLGLYFNVTQFEAGKGRKKKYAIPEYMPFTR